MHFAGPFEGHMYLVVVDAHSKWPEVQIMGNTMASKTVKLMRNLFSRYGIPHILVSNNEPQFFLDEFAAFFRSNRVKHIRSASRNYCQWVGRAFRADFLADFHATLGLQKG